VTVAVHLNVNLTLIVIRPVDLPRGQIVDGSDHLDGVVPVHVHDHELRPTCDEWSAVAVHAHAQDLAHVEDS